MYCTKCGTKLEEGTNFCPNCGAKVQEQDIFEVVEQKESTIEEEKKPAKCWATFAKVARILGIVAVATCWLPLLIGVEAGAAGIVFAILGKHAVEPESKENSKSGLTMSIVGAAISVLTFFALYVILMLQAFSYMD